MKAILRPIMFGGFTLLTSSLFAQSYIAVELPTGISAANGAYSGVAGGRSLGHATVWDTGGNATDFHPAFLDQPGSVSSSGINGLFGNIMVGYGSGNVTNQRLGALMWQDGVASLIPMPNGGINYLSQAYATNGTDIVGEYIPWASFRDRVSPGDSHAFVYNIASGQFTDLYSGNPTVATGVAAGQQVGYELKGDAEARLWTGNAKNFINLHPTSMAGSMASATDGSHQVGMVYRIVNRPGEAKRGVKIRYDSAVQWSGSAATFQFLPSAYPNSRATGISGNFICGIGTVTNARGTRGAQHALAWTDSLSAPVELHNLLPAGYINSYANGIDASGNVSGSAMDATGKLHAFFWVKVG